jgi:DegV family protein with EDD domain
LGDTILSLHISRKLSGTFESAVMAARELKDQLHIITFDSGCGSAALGFICREARIMERAGASVQAIMDRLDYIRRNVNIILTLDTLEYALKSGRVKALQAALVSLLNVKPIIVLRDGALDMAGMVRTRRRALDRLVDSIRQRMGERLVNVAVVHARDIESARTLMEVVRKTFNFHEIVMTNLSVSVAANLGPGTVGIVAYPVEEG